MELIYPALESGLPFDLLWPVEPGGGDVRLPSKAQETQQLPLWPPWASAGDLRAETSRAGAPGEARDRGHSCSSQGPRHR